jgi:phosphoglycerol transferase MdoB-like AlkP superfamily enzyme
MGGSMFSRSTWYRTIGFQEIWFNDRFRQQGLPDCMDAFVGTCDAAIADWIKRRLEVQSADPYFVHWMTLNSHLPLLVPSILPDGAPCLPALSLAPRTPLCSWYQLVANVHQSVSQLAMGALARPTIFVIVGDHAPPFVDTALRNRFSQTVVPYVLLLPRQENNSSSRILAHNTILPPEKAPQPSGQTR